MINRLDYPLSRLGTPNFTLGSGRPVRGLLPFRTGRSMPSARIAPTHPITPQDHPGRGWAMPQPLRVLVSCGLCGDRFGAEPDDAWRLAIDHCLDEHRATLLADPDSAGRNLTVAFPASGADPARELHPVHTAGGWGWA